MRKPQRWTIVWTNSPYYTFLMWQPFPHKIRSYEFDECRCGSIVVFQTSFNIFHEWPDLLFINKIVVETVRHFTMVSTHVLWNSWIWAILANMILSFPCRSSGRSFSLIINYSISFEVVNIYLHLCHVSLHYRSKIFYVIFLSLHQFHQYVSAINYSWDSHNIPSLPWSFLLRGNSRSQKKLSVRFRRVHLNETFWYLHNYWM